MIGMIKDVPYRTPCPGSTARGVYELAGSTARGVYELARQVSRNAALLTIDRCTKLHAAFKMCRPDGLPASPGRPRVRDLKIPQWSLAWYR
jgi:hypothetical protein